MIGQSITLNYTSNSIRIAPSIKFILAFAGDSLAFVVGVVIAPVFVCISDGGDDGEVASRWGSFMVAFARKLIFIETML